MNAQAAIKLAHRHAKEIFGNEGIEHLGMEEIVFDSDENIWEITVGFFRPWDRPPPDLVGVWARSGSVWRRRTFKVVRIDDETGRVLSVTHREPLARE